MIAYRSPPPLAPVIAPIGEAEQTLARWKERRARFGGKGKTYQHPGVLLAALQRAGDAEPALYDLLDWLHERLPAQGEKFEQAMGVYQKQLATARAREQDDQQEGRADALDAALSGARVLIALASSAWRSPL